MFDFEDAGVRQADQVNHTPPAATSAAMARKRCFAFIVALCADFWALAFDLERRRGILVRSGSEQE